MKATSYWTTTGILALALLAGGGWKVLGGVALLAPRFPRLKEWAYAGVFFNMTGAAVSHRVCRDPAWHIIVTLGFAALAVASWAARPASRRVEGLFAAMRQGI